MMGLEGWGGSIFGAPLIQPVFDTGHVSWRQFVHPQNFRRYLESRGIGNGLRSAMPVLLVAIGALLSSTIKQRQCGREGVNSGHGRRFQKNLDMVYS